MKFTVQEVFHPAAYGLTGPHQAVLADMPADLGGGRCVVDVLPTADVDVQDIQASYDKAAQLMPYALSPSGLRLTFLRLAADGAPVVQSTGHFNVKGVDGDVQGVYLDWLCYRARVGLWASERERVVLSVKQQHSLLHAPQLQLVPSPPRAVEAVPSLTKRVLAL